MPPHQILLVSMASLLATAVAFSPSAFMIGSPLRGASSFSKVGIHAFCHRLCLKRPSLQFAPSSCILSPLPDFPSISLLAWLPSMMADDANVHDRLRPFPVSTHIAQSFSLLLFIDERRTLLDTKQEICLLARGSICREGDIVHTSSNILYL